MRRNRSVHWAAMSAAIVLATAFIRPMAFGQVVINEIVKDERTFDSVEVPDVREFIELYNAGTSAVDIGGWTLNYWNLIPAGGAYHPFVDTIPLGTMIAPGDYFVIGSGNVPFVDLVTGTDALLPDLQTIFELRDGPVGASELKDAVGLDVQRGSEYDNFTAEQLPQVGQGWWGQEISFNAVAPNRVISVGRYLDGRDTNVNGRDFGMLPISPGASNNLTLVDSYTVPNADSMNVGDQITADYASFILARVIDPTDPSGFNPNAIPASPQGGNALIAYDETGGGNAVYSNNYVNKFELAAYIDTEPLGLANDGVGGNNGRIQSEASLYGLGTVDGLFTTPDATGLLGSLFSSNGGKGLGWYIQKIERFGDADFDDDSDVDGGDFLTWQRNVGTAAGGTNAQGDADANALVNAADLNYWRVQHGSPVTGPTGVTKTFLLLVDMNDGGDSWPADNDWQIIKAFDLSNELSAWHNLGIDYDPATGAVVATYDGQTFNFNTETGLVGNFFVGYREGLPGAGNGPARPPTYDMIAPLAAGAVPEPATLIPAYFGALSLLIASKWRPAAPNA